MLGSLKAALVVAALVVAWSTGAPPAFAATFTVRDRSDLGGADRCAPDSASLCTLRAAIQSANLTPGEEDTIVLSPLVYEIAPLPANTGDDDAAAIGDLDVVGDVIITVSGSGATIDGKTISRVLDVQQGRLRMEGVDVRNGAVGPTTTGTCPGGGAFCIRADASVVLVDCDVTASTAPLGGGAYVAGALEVTRGTWSGNSASSNGGGIAVFPGATATVTEATIAKNASGGYGGGIFVYKPNAQLTVVRALIGAASAAEANQAQQGGGIALLDGATATIENSTISGNTANQSGGGILCDSTVPCLAANNVTIAKNNVTSGSGGGIAVTNSAGVPVVVNAILADNAPDDCTGPLSGAPNLVEKLGNGCVAPAGWIVEEDPALAALADNGGPTLTHAIAEETAAFGKGDLATCLDLDQRSEERRQRTDPVVCDLGAFELVPDGDKDTISDKRDLCPETAADESERTGAQKDKDGDLVGDACDCGPVDHKFERGTRGNDDDDGVVNYKDCCPFTSQDAPLECGGQKLSVNDEGCTVPQECACDFKVVDDEDEGRIEVPWRNAGAWRRCVKRAVHNLKDVEPTCRRVIATQTLTTGNALQCGESKRSPGDRDGDEVENESDNCPRKFNPRQQNDDEDMEVDEELPVRGNACDGDNDGDNLRDKKDKCPRVISCKNEDADSDGFGNECDECPWVNTGAPKDNVGCEAGDEQGHKGPVDPPDTCEPPPGTGGGDDDDDDDGEIVNTVVTR